MEKFLLLSATKEKVSTAPEWRIRPILKGGFWGMGAEFTS
jgi:hypothetical protein